MEKGEHLRIIAMRDYHKGVLKPTKVKGRNKDALPQTLGLLPIQLTHQPAQSDNRTYSRNCSEPEIKKPAFLVTACIRKVLS